MSHPNWGKAGDGGDVPDTPGITGFAAQQQFPSMSHLGLAAACVYRQYLTCWNTSLSPNKCHYILVTTPGGLMVLSQCWQGGCLFCNGGHHILVTTTVLKRRREKRVIIGHHADILLLFVLENGVDCANHITEVRNREYQTQEEEKLLAFVTQTKINCHRFPWMPKA